MAQRTGRPHSENPKSDRLFIRVTPEEKKEIQEYAKQHHITLLGLIKKGMETNRK